MNQSFTQFNNLDDIKPELHDIVNKKKENIKSLLFKKNQQRNLEGENPINFQISQFENNILREEKYDLTQKVSENNRFNVKPKICKKVESFYSTQISNFEEEPNENREENKSVKRVFYLEDRFYELLV